MTFWGFLAVCVVCCTAVVIAAFIHDRHEKR